MKFSEALAQGRIPEFGKPDRIVTAHISKVCIFGDRAFKVYNHEKHFFADMSDFQARKSFYTEDFFWNNVAAPEIYLHLWGVTQTNDSFKLVPPGMGEDFAIEMTAIDDSKTLTNLLLQHELTAVHAAAFVDTLVDTLATLTKERKEEMDDLHARGLFGLMEDNIDSLYKWMCDVEHIERDDTENVRSLLSQAITRDAYFSNTSPETLVAAIDVNSDNLVLCGDRPSFIDIMPPMRIWRVVDEHATLFRFFVDLEVMGNIELRAAAETAYAKYNRDIPPVAACAHELRAACIQWAYRYMLCQNDLAEKFGTYAKHKQAELAQLLT